MARPTRYRSICDFPKQTEFGPLCQKETQSIEEFVTLHLDEYEAIRLIDLEKLTQEECAKQMDVARTTVQAIYESAREKIAKSIIEGKRLLIAGGNVRICKRNQNECSHFHCRKHGGEGMGRKKRGELC